MNRYPLWKYIVIVVALVIGLVYTLPNFYGESPAVQVSSGKATVKVTEQTLKTVEDLLRNADLHPNGIFFEQGAQQNTVRVRFEPTEAEKQLQAREVLEKALNPNREDPAYVVALNLTPNTPQWLLSIRALPMYLGLDLRGGVHFLLQVDMRAAITKRAEATLADLRTQLRDKRIRHTGMNRVGNVVEVSFASEEERARANDLLRNTQPDLVLSLPEASAAPYLLRAGSLAAPMEIVEERLIGPSLGEANISAGFKSTLYGFIVIAIFMAVYYQVFGLVSAASLVCNVMMLIALLSMLQATLTLPGIAAIALTLGMAVDSNVLINERIREELRLGRLPQTAISEGYDRAFATILDSNITSLIAGLALLIFGSGPVRGFAVVHCLGIMTSIFTSVVVSRSMINLIYGRQKKLTKVHIGQIWRPDAEKTAR